MVALVRDLELFSAADPDPDYAWRVGKPFYIVKTETTLEIPEVRPMDGDPVPAVVERLVEQYAEVAARHARFTELDDGWFADVAGLQGAWAEAPTPDEARAELESVIASWALVKIHNGDRIPLVEGCDLNGL